MTTTEMARVRELFHPAQGLAYLDAASYGLPPDPTVAALMDALQAWQAGTGRWVDDWDQPAEGARTSFAELIGATQSDIALIPTVSVGMGLVAGSLAAGEEVVVPSDEHVSDLFPLLVAGERGVVVNEVPFDQLQAAIRPSTDLVAFSAVQMQTGRVADLGGITRRAAEVGARVFVDATHATPFVDMAPFIKGIDYLVCAAYKHLLGCRGSSFLYVRADRTASIVPTHANWRGAADPFGTFFGGPLTLAKDASRFNVSLAWFPWVGTTRSLELIRAWRDDGSLGIVQELAAELARRLGLTPTGSSLVCVPVTDASAARSALDAAGVKASVRGGAIRFSPHVYNDLHEIARAADAVRPFVSM